MSNITYQQLTNYENRIPFLELLRLDAYQAEALSEYYQKLLYEKKLLVFIAKQNKEIIGGCYVSNSEYSLYLEQLFIKSTYQNQGIGTSLIYYILKHKQIVDDYFNISTNLAKLCPASPSSERLYRRLGFKDSDISLTGSMIKRI
jgi:GNAT superfamily N-acetyltransferase